MKRFLGKLARFFPLIMVIVILNVLIDPANIYKVGYEAKAAKLLVSGKNVAGMTDYDERLLQEEIIKRENGCPTTIILGSSRVMTMSGETIPISNYRNHGVSGAVLFDYLGILGVYEACNKMPEQVIVGLDPWILNKNNGESRYQSLMGYIDVFQETLGIKQTTGNMHLGSIEKKLQFLSIPYFQSSVKKLLLSPKESFDFNRNIDFYELSNNFSIINVKEAVRYTDGSIDYNKKTREKDIDAVNADAKEYVTGSIYHIEEYNGLCTDYCDILEKLVEYLQNRGVTVVFYLPPYHPYVYEYLVENSNYRSVFEAEKFFINLAREKGISVYGAYNPMLLECTESDFIDGMHMLRSSTGKSWRILLEDT